MTGWAGHYSYRSISDANYLEYKIYNGLDPATGPVEISSMLYQLERYGTDILFKRHLSVGFAWYVMIRVFP